MYMYVCLVRPKTRVRNTPAEERLHASALYTYALQFSKVNGMFGGGSKSSIPSSFTAENTKHGAFTMFGGGGGGDEPPGKGGGDRSKWSRLDMQGDAADEDSAFDPGYDEDLRQGVS